MSHGPSCAAPTGRTPHAPFLQSLTLSTPVPLPQIPESSDSEEEVDVNVEIAAADEMPEGAAASDDDEDLSQDDPHRALNIDLDAPIDASEMVLPTRSHHIAKDVSTSDLAAQEKKKAKDKKKKKDGKKKKDKKKKEEHHHEHVSLLTMAAANGGCGRTATHGDQTLSPPHGALLYFSSGP